jgi:small conductance mechanosensitive channel
VSPMTANLILDSLRNLWEGFVTRLPSIVTGILLLLAFYLLARGVRYLVGRSMGKVKVSEHAVKLVARLSFIGVMASGVLVALVVMGINPAALVASLGLVSVGLGFGLKDVIENFIAGVILIFQRPFVVGDVVCLGNVEGLVEDVRVRDTVIRMYDGRQVFVPNASIFSQAVINNNSNRRRRLDFEVGIAYQEDIPSAMGVAVEALMRVEGTLEDPKPLVVAEGLAESAVSLRVFFWVDPVRTNILEAESAAITAVKESLQKAGIEIPYPIITIKPEG